MDSVRVVNSISPRTYPYLGISPQGTVFMFLPDGGAVVVYCAENCNFNLGEAVAGLIESNFIYFDGVISLSN